MIVCCYDHYTGAICIKTLLMENKTIKSLCIEDNKILDEGAVTISKGLRSNHSLTTLRIWGCGLSVKGGVVVRFVCGLDDSEVFHVSYVKQHLYICIICPIPLWWRI